MTLIVLFCFLTAAALTLHWISVLAGVLKLSDSPSGHRNWSLSFVGPDAWLGVLSVLTGVLLISGSELGGLCGLVYGGSLVSNALYIASYLVATRHSLPRADQTMLAVMGLYTGAFGIVLLAP